MRSIRPSKLPNLPLYAELPPGGLGTTPPPFASHDPNTTIHPAVHILSPSSYDPSLTHSVFPSYKMVAHSIGQSGRVSHLQIHVEWADDLKIECHVRFGGVRVCLVDIGRVPEVLKTPSRSQPTVLDRETRGNFPRNFPSCTLTLFSLRLPLGPILYSSHPLIVRLNIRLSVDSRYSH